MSQINEYELKEKFLKHGRWYARLSLNGKTQTMPFSNYIWLKYNSCFEEIPRGYAIHHLDYDPLNDDISNLALMGKFQHTAHHWKYKNHDVQVRLNLFNQMQIDKAKIHYRKDRNVYWIFYNVEENGEKKQKCISNSGIYGQTFKTREEAEQYAKRIGIVI